MRDIVADMKRTGYDDWYSMEPLIVSVVHEGRDATGNEERARKLFLQYGKAFEALYRNAQ